MKRWKQIAGHDRRAIFRLLAVAAIYLAQIPSAAAGLFSLSEQDEIAIGREAAAQVEAKAPIVHDPEVQRYITHLGLELAAVSARPNLPWRFRVIQDERINAFALPGGFVYIHSKVLQLARSEAELAAVIAHEIGHVEGRHHKALIEKAMRYQFGLNILGALMGRGGAANAAMIAAKLLAQGQLTRYSRQAEMDADRRGVMLLYKAGFDPMAMSRFLQNLVRLEPANRDLLADFFADHPAARDRVAFTRTLARSLAAKVWRPDSVEFLRISQRLHGSAGAFLLGGARIGIYGGARIHPLKRGGRYPGARIRPRRR